MANTVIQLKHSTITSNVPTSLANGEISINNRDGKFFYSTPAGVIVTHYPYTGPAGLNQEIQFNDSGVLGSDSGLTYNKTTDTLTVAGQLLGSTLKSTQSAGDEGGQLDLSTAATNQSLSGGSVAIDIYQNRLRIFETGGTNRGVYIDMANGATAGVGTNLLAPSSSTDGWARGQANAAFIQANSAFLQANTPDYVANSAASYANAAFAVANNAFTTTNGSIAWATANSAGSYANAAFAAANTGSGSSSAGPYANAAFAVANSAASYANAAFAAANTGSSASSGNTSFSEDSFTGDGSTTAFTLSTSANQYTVLVAVNGVLQPNSAYSIIGTNTTLTMSEAPQTSDTITVKKVSGGSSLTSVSEYANSAFATSNSASSYANAAFAVANTSLGSSSAGFYANSGFAVANSAALYANAGFAVANSSASYANSAFLLANNSYSTSLSPFLLMGA